MAASVVKIRADQVIVGDEIIAGPQGIIETAPTVLRIERIRPVVGTDDVIRATLIDEEYGEHTASWYEDSRIAVLRQTEEVA